MENHHSQLSIVIIRGRHVSNWFLDLNFLRHSPCFMINQRWVTWCVYSVFGSFILRILILWWTDPWHVLQAPSLCSFFVVGCDRELRRRLGVVASPMNLRASRGAPPNDPGRATHCSSCRKPSIVKRTKLRSQLRKMRWEDPAEVFCFLRNPKYPPPSRESTGLATIFRIAPWRSNTESSRDVNTLEILCFWNYMVHGGVGWLAI